ncbi:YeeE/YedE thiosulfate transporter family protein [Paracoccus salsus]|uniref:YeeE/YedE thiosulfate transporter family protein n=1 Tax=Paracoccus salsus TaxID=2911061 RepID=UPI001F257777|nr:YeeE/YedE thiosulfate transporter family protein [Paracoccus salsus]MCF3972611.1 YeeE/YedE family protein [Paracoccus salsus]
MQGQPKPYWPPLLAGLGLGLTLLMTFVITGHGLGSSGFFTRAAAAAGGWLMPEATADNAYLSRYLGAGAPLLAWITWEVVGLFVGALLGSYAAGRFRPSIERGPGTGAGLRLALALGGGVVTGFGARLARGCTSGLGLSGGATLAVAGFVFLIAFFIGGFLFSKLTRKVWE